jgi:hypothetical protein
VHAIGFLYHPRAIVHTQQPKGLAIKNRFLASFDLNLNNKQFLSNLMAEHKIASTDSTVRSPRQQQMELPFKCSREYWTTSWLAFVTSSGKGMKMSTKFIV